MLAIIMPESSYLVQIKRNALMLRIEISARGRDDFKVRWISERNEPIGGSRRQKIQLAIVYRRLMGVTVTPLQIEQILSPTS